MTRALLSVPGGIGGGGVGGSGTGGGGGPHQRMLSGGTDEEEDDIAAEDSYVQYFTQQRHLNRARVSTDSTSLIQKWRMKERMKTVSVAMVVCLNIGVDPPDVIKTSPCARVECWIDPFTLPPSKALEQICKTLQTQYERWQPRARYKQSMDPTVEEVKKLCTSLRRNAKDERVLFHYNGHGVPRPTHNGEIWVFNKNYTQYIPLSVYDLQTWMGSPSIFVYDCSNAGTILNSFTQFAAQRQVEYDRFVMQNPGVVPSMHIMPLKDCIQLAACGPNQLLPMTPDLPADVFTSCLTTPIEIALRWFVKTRKLVPGVTVDLLDEIPGRLNDRRTPLGELNWIFTAITDTIAWNVLPRDLFHKLFRQDLLVASLYRNFLLAERIMRSVNCVPMSSPKLPSMYQHYMWQAWDLAVDVCLAQLVGLLDGTQEFQHSPFFSEQLTAFEVWLDMGNESRKPPEQLPIVLQVLLSQVHRLRALELLGRFLDLGPWAVNLALSVGIFPYVLKLLQSPAPELRPVLVFIWTKILAVDKSCQADLVKDNGHRYFKDVLRDTVESEQQTMAVFVLSSVMDSYRPGQEAVRTCGILPLCLERLNNPDPILRQWLCLCLGKLWHLNDQARWLAMQEDAHERLCGLLTDPVPEVRAAAVYALGEFLGNGDRVEQVISIEHNISITLVVVTADASPMVRRELVFALAALVSNFDAQFRLAALDLHDETAAAAAASCNSGVGATLINNAMSPVSDVSAGSSATTGVTAPERGGNGSRLVQPAVEALLRERAAAAPGGTSNSVYICIWKVLLALACDPMPEVAFYARGVCDSVHPVFSAAVAAADNSVGISTRSSPLSSPRLSKISADVPSRSRRSVADRARSKATGLLRRSTSLKQSISSSGLRDGDDVERPASPFRSSTTMNLIVPDNPVSLVSEFYHWSAERFRRPVIKMSDELDSLSDTFAHNQWCHHRNQLVIREASSVQKVAGKKKLDDQIAILDNETEMVSLMRFHPFEPYLVVADQADTINVWNWSVGQCVNFFTNGNPAGSRITSIRFLNETDDALLIVGSDEGVVRIWRKWMSRSEQELVIAWRALSDLLPSSRGSGLVCEWEQDSGHLFASGDVRVIRLWNAERELCVQDIPTGADSCITSMSVDRQGKSLLVCGCGDGTVRLYDRRLPPRESLVLTLDEHKGWVVDVHLQKGADRELVTGSVTGDIKFWDPRFTQSVKTIQAFPGAMTALSVHDNAPVFACGSHNQSIKIFSTSGNALSNIRYHDGFLGQRIGPVSCLAFHPHKVVLAAGSTDSIVSIYTCDSHG